MNLNQSLEWLRMQGGKTMQAAIVLLRQLDSPEALLLVIDLIENSRFPGRTKLIVDLCRHENAEVRLWAVELLDRVPRQVAIKMLIALARDKDMLVRTTVMEMISCIGTRDSTLMSVLIDGIKDVSPFVRAHAAISLGELKQKSSVTILKSTLEKEKYRSVRLALYYALYLLYFSRNTYLQNVLEFLDDKNYRNRCAAANLLGNVHETDRRKVIQALRCRQSKENTVAVNSSISSSLKILMTGRRPTKVASK
jgi:HEAT repeat protein